MFNTDKPIDNISSDLLNRASFSEQLAKAILSYTNTDNFTISLCGKWGSGKTSILNMVETYINTLTQNYSEDGTESHHSSALDTVVAILYIHHL